MARERPGGIASRRRSRSSTRWLRRSHPLRGLLVMLLFLGTKDTLRDVVREPGRDRRQDQTQDTPKDVPHHQMKSPPSTHERDGHSRPGKEWTGVTTEGPRL